MIKLEIKNIFSPDVDQIEIWEPRDNCVYFQLELNIGEYERIGSDIFQVTIATLEGIKKQNISGNILSKRCLFLFNIYSWKSLDELLTYVVKKCETESWVESCLKLQRYFYWEYEDYNE